MCTKSVLHLVNAGLAYSLGPLACSVGSVGNVGILENFSGGILWGLFGFGYIAYIPYTIISLLKRGRVVIYRAPPRISWIHKRHIPSGQIKQSRSGIRVDIPS